MRRSEALLFTSREPAAHKNETVALMMRAGLMRQFGSGLYGFTPTGQRVRRHVSNLIREEMDAIGAQEISLPSLNYSGIWKQSGRWGSFEGEMFTLENRAGQQMCLAPSHEEGVVHLIFGVVRSYDELPCLLYQIESKYRDDHARNGLIRTKEFTMKDAYSLHATRDSLEETYEEVREAYIRIFEALELDFAVTAADNSVMGGSASEEFVALADTGTLTLRHCVTPDCRFGVTDESAKGDLMERNTCPQCGERLKDSEGIEIGHVFKLGTRYAESMGVTIHDADGSECDVLMGSYGIGIERLLHSLIEQHRDEDGCRWGEDGTVQIAPYRAAIVPLEYSGDIRNLADSLYESCGYHDTLLFDDTTQTIGERFAESDLLGIPWKIVLGNHYRETGEVELEGRDGSTRYVNFSEVEKYIK